MADDRPIPDVWGQGIDAYAWSRNWTQDELGAQRRMGNRGNLLDAMASKVNYLLSRNPRPTFMECQNTDSADTAGLDPIYRFKYYDGTPNGRALRVHVIMKNIEDPGDSYTGEWDGSYHYTSTHVTPVFNNPNDSLTDFENVIYTSFLINRIGDGSAPDAEIEEGLSTFNGCTLLSVNVQEVEPFAGIYNEDDHVYVEYQNNQKGTKVLEGLPEKIRSKLHTVRTENLPIVLSWAAQGDTATTSSPGGVGVATFSKSVDGDGTYRNVFDHTQTTRDATTIGASVDVQYAGRGAEDETAGQTVKVVCRVLAKMSSAAVGLTGDVQFLGPLNTATISVTGTTLQWWGTTEHIDLDPTVAWDEATSAMNKIDVHGRVNSPFVALEMYIYAIRCWIEYE